MAAVIKAFHNRNPVLREEPLINPWGVECPMMNEPFVGVELEGLPPGEYDVQLETNVHSARQRVRMDGTHEVVYFLHQGFGNVPIERARVELKNRTIHVERELSLHTYLLEGRAVSFAGQPLEAFVWVTRLDRGKRRQHEIITKADKTGGFGVYCPGGRLWQIFVDDRTYARSTLEGWIVCPGLDRDLRLPEIRVGDFEVYDLQAWFSAGLWHVFFIPARVDVRVPPLLAKEDVGIWINDATARILTMTRHQLEGGYPAYIMSVEPPVEHPEGLQFLRVRVDSREKGQGEAWYITSES